MLKLDPIYINGTAFFTGRGLSKISKLRVDLEDQDGTYSYTVLVETITQRNVLRDAVHSPGATVIDQRGVTRQMFLTVKDGFGDPATWPDDLLRKPKMIELVGYDLYSVPPLPAPTVDPGPDPDPGSDPPPPPTPTYRITSPATASVYVTDSFTYTITTNFSADTFTASPLPAGMRLVGNMITDAATSTGVTTVTLTATDSRTNSTATATLEITVSPQPTPTPPPDLSVVLFIGAFGHEPPTNVTNAQLATQAGIIFGNSSSGEGLIADIRATRGDATPIAIYKAVAEMQDAVKQSYLPETSGDLATLAQSAHPDWWLYHTATVSNANRAYNSAYNVHYLDVGAAGYRTWAANKVVSMLQARDWADGIYLDNCTSNGATAARANGGDLYRSNGSVYAVTRDSSGNITGSPSYAAANNALAQQISTAMQTANPDWMVAGNVIDYAPSDMDMWHFLDIMAPEQAMGYSKYSSDSSLNAKLTAIDTFLAISSRKCWVSNCYTRMTSDPLFAMSWHAMIVPQGAQTVTVGSRTYPRASFRWYDHSYDKIWLWPSQLDGAYGAPTGPRVQIGTMKYSRPFTNGTWVCDIPAKRGTWTANPSGGTTTPPTVSYTAATVPGLIPLVLS